MASTGTSEKLVSPVGGSSRDSLAGAGWTCKEIGKFRGLVSAESRPFSWLSLAPLWRSRNQIVGSLFGDPTNDERRRWMDIQHKAGKLQPNLVIEEHADLEEFSFLVVGDTGEGDASQFAVGNRARRGCGIHGRTARDRARAGGNHNAYVSRRARRIAERILPLPGRGRGPLHHYFFELFDWNDPPLFKNFLRIDVHGSELSICCFAATGCLDHERNPPLEDEVRISLEPPPAGSDERQERLE
jgi:hypothetical protein